MHLSENMLCLTESFVYFDSAVTQNDIFYKENLSLSCFRQDSSLYPSHCSDSAIPAPSTNQILIFKPTTDGN